MAAASAPPHAGAVKVSKEEFLREWALDINGVDSVFKKASDNLIDAHRESSATSSEFCVQLAEMAQREKDVHARAAIQLLADEITKADHHRLELAGALHAQTTSMARFGQQLKATQEVISSRNKAFKAYSNRAANYTRKRKSGKAKEKELKDDRALLERDQERMFATENECNSAVSKFEGERVDDTKKYMEALILGQMKFYARSIEGLTDCYRLIDQIGLTHEQAARLAQLQAEIPGGTILSPVHLTSPSSAGAATPASASAAAAALASPSVAAMSPSSSLMTPTATTTTVGGERKGMR